MLLSFAAVSAAPISGGGQDLDLDFSLRVEQGKYYQGERAVIAITKGPLVGDLMTIAGPLNVIESYDSMAVIEVPNPDTFGDGSLDFSVPFVVSGSNGTDNDSFEFTVSEAVIVQLGTASESDSAGSVSVGQGVNVGTASETDSAGSVTPIVPVTVSVGTASETDQAGSVSVEHSVNVGTASETDSAGSANNDLAIVSGPSGNFKPGDLVSITIIGDGTETLSNSAGAVVIASNDGTTLTFNAPEPPLFGDKSLNYYDSVEYTITRGAQTATFNLVVEPRVDELHALITSVFAGGIYDGDGVNVGVDYGHFKNVSSGVSIDASDGSFSVTEAGTAEYAIYSNGAWSNYFSLNFEAPSVEVNVGTASETDSAGSATAQLGGGPVNVATGTPSESDSAGSVTAQVEGGPVNVGTATPSESDSAGTAAASIDPDSAVSVNTPSESDQAGSVTPEVQAGPIVVNVGTAQETDSAGSVAPPINVSVGTASETDSAGSVSVQELAFMPRNVIEFIVPVSFVDVVVPNSFVDFEVS